MWDLMVKTSCGVVEFGHLDWSRKWLLVCLSLYVIACTNADLLSAGTNFSEIWSKIHNFSLRIIDSVTYKIFIRFTENSLTPLLDVFGWSGWVMTIQYWDSQIGDNTLSRPIKGLLTVTYITHQVKQGLSFQYCIILNHVTLTNQAKIASISNDLNAVS